jgi:hypothetical protein
MCIGGSFPGVKQLEHKADHSRPSSAEVKEGGVISPLSLTSSWRGVSLIKHRTNFTFILNVPANSSNNERLSDDSKLPVFSLTYSFKAFLIM